MKKTLILLATAFCMQLHAQICFNATTTYTIGSGYNPYAIINADFNGDGKLDLAVSNNVPYNVSVFLNTGNGIYGAPTNFSVGSNPRSITCADFDNDGNMDLATSDAGISKVSVLLGNGAGSFTLVATVATGNHPEAITSGDFDGDGKIDLATSNDFSNDVTVLLNTTATVGTATFGAATSFAVGSSPQGLTSADFDGDGKVDIAVTNSGSNTISVLWNNGSVGAASFLVTAGITVGTSPTVILTNDFNGDGNFDLIVGNVGNNTLSVLLNSASSPYFAAATNSTTYSQQSITCGDFNADGKVDVAVANLGVNKIDIFKGQGNGHFTFDGRFACGGTAPYCITSGDLNADGRADVAVGNLTTGTLGVLLNNATLPSLTITPGAATVCQGQNTTLTASGASTYTWTGGISNGVAFTPAATATYTVNAADAIGCTNSGTVAVTVNASPTINVNTTHVTSCAGDTVILVAGGTATSYSWSTTESTSSITVAPTSNIVYTVTGAATNGCSVSATVTFTVNSLPNVSIGAVTINPCAGIADTLYANGTATSYSWSTTETTYSISVTSAAPAGYTLTGTDVNGCMNTATITISPSSLPNVFAVTDTPTLCVGNTANLSGGGAFTYTWSTTATGGSIAVSPTVTTTYTVTGTDVNGCVNIATITQNVTTCTSGIENYMDNVSIYPNPSQGVLVIRLVTVNENTAIHITNVIGQEVMRANLKDADTSLDLFALEKGVYFITITSGSGKHTRKILLD